MTVQKNAEGLKAVVADRAALLKYLEVTETAPGRVHAASSWRLVDHRNLTEEAAA